MLSRFFVDRPIFATVLSIVIVMVGLIALVKLPVAQYPEVAPPVISITASYPGANALDVAENVATPIEQQVNGVENMIYMLSKCTNDGQMTLDVTFKPGTDLNMAQVLVQNRVSIAEAKLPDEVKRQGVTTKKKSPSILLCINLISDKEEHPTPGREFKFDQLYLSNYATLNVKDVLARVEGVGDVTFLGPRDYSMRIWLDPQKTAARGMTPSQVVQSLREQNRQVPAGRIGQPPIPRGQDFQYPLSTPSRIAHEGDFGQVILKASGSAIVKLRDVVSTKVITTGGKSEVVPNIELGAQNYDVNSYLDGEPSVTLAVFQLPGSNALETAEKLKHAMKEMALTFPKGMRYKIVYDTTVFIDESIHEVYKTLFEAFVLVFIVVLIFLQDWRATLMPMIDVPVSLIGTFAIMAVMGFSLNNLTLFGLVLAIGIVVDDAIVVVENIERWMAKGLPPREATVKAMDEITGPVIAITLVLCSVFVPTVFLAGITGKFYSQFALTIAVSTVISAINAMTMAPARAVTLIKPHSANHHGPREVLPPLGYALLVGFIAYHFFSDMVMHAIGVHPPHAHGGEEALESSPMSHVWAVRVGMFVVGGVVGYALNKPINRAAAAFLVGFNRVFDICTEFYGATVTKLLRISVIALVLYAGLLCLTGYMANIVPTGFIPDQDKGYLVVNAQLQDGASLERTDEVMRDMENIARFHDELKDAVDHTINVPGYSILTGTNISNVGGMFVILKPFDKRKHDPELSAQRVAVRMRQIYRDRIISANVAVFGAPPIDGLGNTGGFKLQVQDRTIQGPRALEGAVQNLGRAGMAQKGRLAGMFSSYSANQPQIIARVDRDLATSRNVALGDLYDTLGIYFGSAYVNDFTRFGRNWQVIVQADPEFRREIRNISTLQVSNKDGGMVSLETFVKDEANTGPAIVNRYNMFPSAELNGVPAPGTSSGDAIKLMNALRTELPTGMSFEWTELTFQEIEAGKDPLSPWIFPLSVLFVFMVLSAQYESWSMPFAIILIVPMCILAAYVGIWLVGLDNNIFTQIGLVVLVAMAAKNAILVVEFASQTQREQGMQPKEAVIHAAKTRLRPILMTSAAFILGVVPLVLAKGAGAEMRSALGIAVFSGMLGVTFFGIFLTPVFYVTIRWLVETSGFEPPLTATKAPTPPEASHG